MNWRVMSRHDITEALPNQYAVILSFAQKEPYMRLSVDDANNKSQAQRVTEYQHPSQNVASRINTTRTDFVASKSQLRGAASITTLPRLTDILLNGSVR